MWEFAAKKLIEAAISASQKYFENIAIDRNKRALEEKKKRESKRNITAKELAELALRPNEIYAAKLVVSSAENFQALESHISGIKNWSSTISFSDLRGSRWISEIYVSLDTYLTPVRLHLDASERRQTAVLESAIEGVRRHCIILGQPGAGKTTAMKKCCLSLLAPGRAKESTDTFPILIRFKDIRPEASRKEGVLLAELCKIFPLAFDLSEAMQSASELNEYKRSLYLKFINDCQPTIILDGFDEYPDQLGKTALIEELRQLAIAFSKARLIITCRTGEFNYSLDGAEIFEIAPMDEEQVRSFVERWIGNEKAKSFLEELDGSPFADTAIKPLSLAHLCAIYERIGKIPDRPKTVYRKVVSLLLEEWDEQRSIRRESKYAKFEADRKLEFLSNLSYYLTTKLRASVFTKQHFTVAYASICENFGLDRREVDIVVAEIESHTGLFIQGGYDKYEFVHKSVQEYLAAEYIVKLPSIISDWSVLADIGAELAIVVAISSNPSIYLSDLVMNVLVKAELPTAFYDAFINRLILEKPDFYQNPLVIVAFFTLLTLWINKGRVTNAKKVARSISLEEERTYHKLLTLMLDKNTAAHLDDYYALHDPNYDVEVDGLPIVHVRRKRSVEGYRGLPYLLIPNSFFVLARTHR